MALETAETRSPAAPLAVRRSANGRKPGNGTVDSRFDRQLARVLEHAARIFCEKGYEGASMRDLSRASGMSLAGLYHYFESKEELLYLIQKHTFRSIIENLRGRLGVSTDPEERVRIFVENHLEYFLANKEAMKVLAHEDETLKDTRGAEVRAIKREYYRICLDLLEDLKRTQGLEYSGRLAVLSLFGMMNWFYTWHNPRIDANAKALAEEMSGIFLYGVLPREKNKRRTAQAKP
ncbi:MAG TPA: TetR/AcrR family transcriptional regulator [Candidatus Angelobacter sp.]|nr:TetR/AcrR family transcriptional regulator [Candidatus Angelobacter sp.]